MVVELTTLTEDDEVIQKIREAWSFADTLQLQLQLNGTYFCWLPIEGVKGDTLDNMVSSVQNRSVGLKKDEYCSPERPFPYYLSKEHDSGAKLYVFLFRNPSSNFNEIKLKQRLLEEAREAHSKFEGYEGSIRILLIDVTFCIGREFAKLSVWDAPDQQLNMQIEKTCPRVDMVFLCKSIQAWCGDGQPIPIHGYQAGIVRGRVAPKQRGQLPQYLDRGYWELPQLMYRRKAI